MRASVVAGVASASISATAADARRRVGDLLGTDVDADADDGDAVAAEGRRLDEDAGELATVGSCGERIA